MSGTSPPPPPGRPPGHRHGPARLYASLGALLVPATLAAATALACWGAPAAADTLERVRERGALRCGVRPDLPGFSRADSLGARDGFDVELCRALAGAVLGDAGAIETVPLADEDALGALAAGRVDLLARGPGWTLSDDAGGGELAGVALYDGQGFAVPVGEGVRSALELDGERICVVGGGRAERDLADYATLAGMSLRPRPFADTATAARAYADGLCTALSAERAVLAAERSRLARPRDHLILPEVISKAPSGPLVRGDDAGWEDIVRWTLACTIGAEESGLTRANVRRRDAVATPAAARLAGEAEDLGARLGLGPRWCARIVREVGNYAEMWDRHLGPGTPLALDRGVNRLWTDGGLLYAPPVR